MLADRADLVLDDARRVDRAVAEVGQDQRGLTTVTPSSTDARRAIASSNDSPGAGCPQNEFVHTPGQVSRQGAG